MSAPQSTALDDLHFLRGVVEESGQGHIPRTTGFLLAVAGILYTGEVFFYWASAVGLIPSFGIWNILASCTSTGGFIAAIIWVHLHNRRKNKERSITARAISAAFSGAGIANLALIVVFASNSVRMENFYIWLFHPVVVCALQGAVWYTVAMAKKKLWIGIVAAGWYFTSIALGFLIGKLAFLLVLGFALFFFMAVPGLHLMRGKS